MKAITVFTPTFNRAYCLHLCYESLKRQTNDNFRWLIIDDGSTDNTKELVNSWIAEGAIEIQYHWQENGGMHAGYNAAYSLIETELNVCIDSDDYLTDDAIETILNFWQKNKDDKYAGIVGLDATKDGRIIGKSFPADLHSSTLEDLYHSYQIPGDKKLVYRTEVVKQYPKYPTFRGESFVPLTALWLQIDQDYPLLCLNRILCIVEYMEDGSTRNIFKQYRRHPQGFRFLRNIQMEYSSYSGVKMKAILHHISCNLMLRDCKFLKNNKHKLLTLFFIPLGILFHLYIIYKSRPVSQ